MPFLAGLPVLAVLGLMLGLRWSAARAGIVVAVGSFVLGVVAFDFGRGGADDDTEYGILEGLVGVLAEASFVTLTIAAIIGPALGIHHLQSATGATRTLETALRQLSPDPRIAALLITWFFALFMEGAAGFGTSVALAAPFLVAAGFQPVTAVVAAMIGHVVGVSFGAIGTPVAVQAAISGFTGADLAWPTARFHVALGWILALVVARLVGREHGATSTWRLGLLAAVSFFVPYGLISAFIGPELPTLGGALLGTGVFVAFVARRPDEAPDPSARLEPRDVARAAAPYLALVVVVLATRLVPPVKRALTSVVVDWELFGAFSGSIQPLYHPGLLLAAAFGLGALVQRSSRRDVVHAFVAANRQLLAVSVALVAMVSIARLMSQSGMTTTLAEQAARSGDAWTFIAPMVGALGTFVTGSATASNVLFTELQIDTAAAQELGLTTMLGSQGFGAAAGNAIAPHNIVAAAATVGLAGRESEILRRTLPVTLGYLALGGLLTWIIA